MVRRTTKAGGIVKNAPNALIWAVTLAFLGVIAAFVVLSATGSDSTDLRTFMNTIMNAVGVLFGGGGLVVAGAAARAAGEAKEQALNQAAKLDKVVKQTNGLSASERQEIAERAALTVLDRRTEPS